MGPFCTGEFAGGPRHCRGTVSPCVYHMPRSRERAVTVGECHRRVPRKPTLGVEETPPRALQLDLRSTGEQRAGHSRPGLTCTKLPRPGAGPGDWTVEGTFRPP